MNRKKWKRKGVKRMATASFTKQFVVKDRRVAKRILRDLYSGKSTLKLNTDHIDAAKELARGEELLKNFKSR